MPPHENDKKWIDLATALAHQGYSEGGCPIGAVLVDNETQQVLGKGFNKLVQEGNCILHGEMTALRDAGRIKSRRNTTMYTSLTPCMMCTGTIIQFKIGRVVIGDATNAKLEDSKAKLFADAGIEVVILENEENVALVKKFIEEKPELWLEDWGGN